MNKDKNLELDLGLDLQPDYLKDKQPRKQSKEYLEGQKRFIATPRDQIKTWDDLRKLFYYDTELLRITEILEKEEKRLKDLYPLRAYCSACDSIVELLDTNDEDLFNFEHNRLCHKCWADKLTFLTCKRLSIPSEFRTCLRDTIQWDYENRRKDIGKALKRGDSVFLNGERKSGKTHLVVAYLITRQEENVLFTNENQLLDMIDEKDSKRINALSLAKCLLIDDIGLYDVPIRRVITLLTKIVSERIERKLQTVITSGMGLMEFQDYTGKQIYNKITTNYSSFQLIKPYKETK